MTPHLITVPRLSAPTRLDKFLTHQLPGLSRSAIQHAIKQGQVKVGGKQVPVHHFLKPGEVVVADINTTPKQAQLKPEPGVPWQLINETDDYLVVEKPAGLVVHPAPGVDEPTLVDGLIAHYPELAQIGNHPLRPGIVHRLDREVSGVMVVARTAAMFQHLTTAFAARQVAKQYTALVVGHVAQPEGTITFPLSRGHGRRGRVAARPAAGDDTREAVTHYTVRQQFQQAALLDIAIATGRTHQIRAHLAALGHPIVGDQVYRPKSLAFKASPGRIFLHAATLAFNDLHGARQTFTSPLPAKLQQFLTHLH